MVTLDRERLYEPIVVTSVILFMLWTRLKPINNFIRGRIYFSANDAYYHYREIMYTVHHWPFTMPFDPWTNFPFGTATGQFGTLYDQLVATAALVVGLGHPSTKLVGIVTLIAPAVFGAATAVPVYFLTKKLSSRTAALIAIGILALIPGTFFVRSTVGFSDHHAAEVFFHASAVCLIVYMLAAAYTDPDIVDVTTITDFKSIGYAVGAGIAMLLYIFVWPPAIFLVGILGVYFAIAAVVGEFRGEDLERLMLPGVVSMIVLTFGLLPFSETGFHTTTISWLQIGLVVGVFLECLTFVWLQRRLRNSRLFAVVISLAAIGLVVGILLSPIHDVFVRNMLRTFLFNPSTNARTIAEAQPIQLSNLPASFLQQYGLAFGASMLGIFIVGTYRFERQFSMIWYVAILLMAITQIRFNYYYAIGVAVFGGIATARVLAEVDLPSAPEDLKMYHFMTFGVILLVLVAPVVPPLGSGSVLTQNAQPNSLVWAPTMHWMANNTPEENLTYYGTYHRGFHDPPGTYGVMSWWDYGHWITVMGRRVAIANPFQQNAINASKFFVAKNETAADAELQRLSPNRPIKYVIIDDQMAGGKFSAIATWSGPSPSSYYARQSYQINGSKQYLYGPDKNYDRTMLSRLYIRDTNGLQHYRLIHDSRQQTILGSVAKRSSGAYQSTNFVNRRITFHVFQVVKQRSDLAMYDTTQTAAVKIFEHVPGAKIEGGANTSMVTAELTLKTNTGRTVRYTQTVPVVDGHYTIIVPYTTSSNGAVSAKGPYKIVSGGNTTKTVDVNETAVETGLVV